MAHYEPPHQVLYCLQIQLFESLVVKELTWLINVYMNPLRNKENKSILFKNVVSSTKGQICKDNIVKVKVVGRVLLKSLIFPALIANSFFLRHINCCIVNLVHTAQLLK